MYRPYFGLSQLPFKITPELAMFYSEGSRQEILEALKYTLERGDGILKVVGEVGSGKAMLLKLLAHSLQVGYKIIYINSPNFSSKDLLRFICAELEIPFDDNSPKFSLVNQLQKTLLSLHSKGVKVVMLIDEAQVMTIDGLEEVRLLSNLETDQDKLLQIVLFGQPELDVALSHANIRQLASRISYNIYIPAFSAEDVHSYLNFRMRKSGYSGIDVFSPKIAKRLFKISEGYPRAINVLADKLLMATFSQQDKIVKSKHFQAIDINSNKKKRRFGFAITAFTVLSFIATVGFINFAEKPTEMAAIDKVLEPISKNAKKDDADEVQLSNKTYTDAQDIDIKEQESQSEFKLTELEVVNPISTSVPEDSPVFELFKMSQDWLDKLVESGYSIQMAAIPLSRLNLYKEDVRRLGVNMDEIHFILDYKSDRQFYRVKVFYGNESTLSAIKKKLQTMPSELLRSKPFVVPFKIIHKSFGKTKQFLINGGSNDGEK